MTDTDTLQQLQNCIAKMEWHHEEELRKLKVDHDHLEAYVSCPQGDEYSAYALPERTQGKSHPQHTVNTQDDLSLSHMHCPVGQATR